ncbi:YjzC family protein [Paenibacillus sp. B01]|uniref:YjzC family protein n=1 Tax=Paenibacillus sp. B01 TaxID=2660554 RepID=UPI00129BC2CB|nr:YjzC family protein [Paenibacillus sp. B01]QGG58490.1 YjzC family protein [Paenibacillus sp. B01]
MGERTKFVAGFKAPNDGWYMEAGEDSFHMGISHPKKISLKKGQHFPKNTNHNRVWVKMPKV